METIELDPERQKKARQYARISRRLSIFSMAFSAAYVLAWLIFRWGTSLGAFLQSHISSPVVQVALFAAFFGGIMSVLTLPLDFYTGYSLPHRFGMSTQTIQGWLVDQGKGLLIGVPLGLALLELVYALLRWQPDSWWIWVAAALIVINVLLANLAPVLLMPIFNKFVPLGDEHSELADRLVRLAERAGAKVRGVYQFDMSRRTKAANAALTGLGSTRRIILGDTLLAEFSTDEIETVMAHELGHHANNDILLGILVESAVTLVGLLLAFLGLRWGVSVFGFQGPADPAAMPLLAVVMGLYGLVTMPLANGFSRWRERRADQFALHLTGNGVAFASALTRLANQNLSQVDPEPWVEWLFYSHPSLGKRIAMAKASTQNNNHHTSD
jgi:STE24 endopeptidase